MPTLSFTKNEDLLFKCEIRIYSRPGLNERTQAMFRANPDSMPIHKYLQGLGYPVWWKQQPTVKGGVTTKHNWEVLPSDWLFDDADDCREALAEALLALDTAVYNHRSDLTKKMLFRMVCCVSLKQKNFGRQLITVHPEKGGHVYSYPRLNRQASLAELTII